MTKTARQQLAANTARNTRNLATYADNLGRRPAPTTAALLAAIRALKV